MHLRETILREHSKENTRQVANWIGTDTKRLNDLVQLFLHDEYKVVQRSAWIISVVAERHPGLVQQHLPALVHRMNDTGVHVAVKRNVVRILQFTDIPETLHGEVMQTCFALLADPGETVAVRCFSMTVLANLAKQYPEIKQELRLLIDDALQHEPPAGLRSRAKQVLRQL